MRNLNEELITKYLNKIDDNILGLVGVYAIEEEGIKHLSSLLKKIPLTLGDGKKRFLPEEKKVGKKMRYW